jgi:hypothetical protein
LTKYHAKVPRKHPHIELNPKPRKLSDFIQLIPDWKKAHRFNSIRLAVFWAGLNGAVLSISAFADYINPWLFLALNTAGYAVIGFARITKQPGLD